MSYTCVVASRNNDRITDLEAVHSGGATFQWHGDTDFSLMRGVQALVAFIGKNGVVICNSYSKEALKHLLKAEIFDVGILFWNPLLDGNTLPTFAVCQRRAQCRSNVLFRAKDIADLVQLKAKT